MAHRGDSAHAPENTLEAARLGLDSGADGWELDVRLTRDGIPLVIHDESLARTTDVARRFEGDPRGLTGFRVGDFSFEEIRSLDAGSWFVAPEGVERSAHGFGTLDRLTEFDRALFGSGTIRVPSLLEALGLTRRLGSLLNVEIKPPTEDRERLLARVLDSIRETEAFDQVTVSSFDHAIVADVSRLEPRVATGALVFDRLDGSAADLLRSIGADALHAPPALVGQGTHEKVPILVYTVNDSQPAGLAWELGRRGVAGLFTDDPVAIASRFSLTPPSRRTRFH